MLKLTGLIGLAALAFCSAVPAMAANVDVQMLNRGEAGAMVFEPALVVIQPGDTVTFIPTDKSHNAESIKEMLPEGAEPFKGKLDEKIVVTFDIPGAYGIKCLPHLNMGMVGLIIVGDEPANLEAVKAERVPPRARQRFETIFAEYDALP